MSDNKKEWWKRGKFYSLYIDTFAGDIPGLIEKLPYFTTLGIDCLHILPFYPSPMGDGGYDISDHKGVRSELGTVDDFKRLCDAAHSQGLKVMVDLVLNHTSEEHLWFVEARASKDNPKRDFFIWNDTQEKYKEALFVFSDFKDSNWIWNEKTQDYYYATFKPCQPDLNWNNPKVQEAMFRVADTLISYGVDGFRLDAVTHLAEEEGTQNVHTASTHARLRELRAYLDTHHPGVILLGEVINTTDVSRAYFGAGDECQLAYNAELMGEILYALLCGDEQQRLKTVLEAARQIPEGASWMLFLRNHDSVSLYALDPERHQQLLNRIDPERKHMFNRGAETVQRLMSICGNDEGMLREAFAMLYAIPSASVMYYGDEIGMKNAPLPEGENDMRYTVRAPFDWNEAERQMNDPNSLFHYVRKLISH